MLLPELPEALIVRRNAHGFSHSFTALQMDKYGRDCAEVAQMEVARLTAELGDLPQAQAEMLTEIKALRANNRELLDQRYVLMQVEPMTAVADRYAHRMALELECEQQSLWRTSRPVNLNLPQQQRHFCVSLPDKFSTFSFQSDAFCK